MEAQANSPVMVAKIIWAVFLVSAIAIAVIAWKQYGMVDPNAVEFLPEGVDLVDRAKKTMIMQAAAALLVLVAFFVAKKGDKAKGDKQFPLYLVRLVVLDIIVMLGYATAMFQQALNPAVPIFGVAILGFILSFPKFK